MNTDGPCRDRTCDLGIKSRRMRSRGVSCGLAIRPSRTEFRADRSAFVSGRLCPSCCHPVATLGWRRCDPGTEGNCPPTCAAAACSRRDSEPTAPRTPLEAIGRRAAPGWDERVGAWLGCCCRALRCAVSTSRRTYRGAAGVPPRSSLGSAQVYTAQSRRAPRPQRACVGPPPVCRTSRTAVSAPPPSKVATARLDSSQPARNPSSITAPRARRPCGSRLPGPGRRRRRRRSRTRPRPTRS
jgi:hypothetical protein